MKVVRLLETVDEKGDDKKMIMVPSKNVSPVDADIESIDDLPKMFLEKVIYFYQHYKDLEHKKVTIGKMMNKVEAVNAFKKSVQNLQG